MNHPANTTKRRQEDGGNFAASPCALLSPTARESQPVLPDYLEKHYWWAYLHPNAVRFFDRPWIINLILLGNYRRLARAARVELGDTTDQSLLQVACAYGELTPRIVAELRGKATLDVIDIAQIQLDNLRRKLPADAPVRLWRQDSTALGFHTASFDQTLLFFLLHEQPEEARRETLAEALRVTRPGGKLVIVDFHSPSRLNPARYFMNVVLKLLEPFARDLWRHEIRDYLPAAYRQHRIRQRTCFGGLYQILSIDV
ncbi:MAG: class I SAM-dependent methyltransferase [Rhodocyclales bacterium GT-UBC]|nr:MAG: class I SAM-dependent methyltransferase [Rhodocyclales bacterium GT-UBC]